MKTSKWRFINKLFIVIFFLQSQMSIYSQAQEQGLSQGLIQNQNQYVNQKISSAPVPVLAPTQYVPLDKDPLKAFFLEQIKTSENIIGISQLGINLQIQPNGEIKGAFPLECQPRAVENTLYKLGRTGKEFADEAQKLFSKCEFYWNAPEKQGVISIIDFLFTYYNVWENPLITSADLKLRDGSTIQALIGVKDLTTKRPWVIIKCGVFCTVGDTSSTANYMMSFFDQSPFNVIFLSNRTGTEYIQKNESLTLAGYLESHDFYEVGRWLKEESQYKDTIDSIHAVGISLGGSAAMYIDPLADAYGYDENHRLFQSVMAICPVINLEPTIYDMYGDSLKGVVFSKYTWDQLQTSKNALSEAKDFLSSSKQPAINQFPNILSTIAARYSSKWAANANLYRHTKEIYTQHDLWSQNQMNNYDKEMKTPYLVWASKDDMVVNNVLNTQSFYKSLAYVRSPNVGILNVAKGNHCGFSTAYGYPVVSSILKSFVLSHSNEFAQKRKLQKAEVNLGISSVPWFEFHIRQWWQATANSDTVSLFYEVHDSVASFECRLSNPLTCPAFCRKIIEKKIPLSELNFLSLSVPKNNTEANVLSRRLNGILRITANGQAIEGTSMVPNQVEWFSYY